MGTIKYEHEIGEKDKVSTSTTYGLVVVVVVVAAAAAAAASARVNSAPGHVLHSRCHVCHYSRNAFRCSCPRSHLASLPLTHCLTLILSLHYGRRLMIHPSPCLSFFIHPGGGGEGSPQAQLCPRLPLQVAHTPVLLQLLQGRAMAGAYNTKSHHPLTYSRAPLFACFRLYCSLLEIYSSLRWCNWLIDTSRYSLPCSSLVGYEVSIFGSFVCGP